jgi:hypothetical protein
MNLSTIPVKFSTRFHLLQFVWKGKGIRIAKIILEKNNKVRWLRMHDFKTSYIALIIKIKVTVFTLKCLSANLPTAHHAVSFSKHRLSTVVSAVHTCKDPWPWGAWVWWGHKLNVSCMCTRVRECMCVYMRVCVHTCAHVWQHACTLTYSGGRKGSRESKPPTGHCAVWKGWISSFFSFLIFCSLPFPLASYQSLGIL